MKGQTMRKLVVYESRLQRTIDRIDRLNDDIYWGTITAPIGVGVALTLPLRLLADMLEALPLPMKVIQETIIK